MEFLFHFDSWIVPFLEQRNFQMDCFVFPLHGKEASLIFHLPSCFPFHSWYAFGLQATWTWTNINSRSLDSSGNQSSWVCSHRHCWLHMWWSHSQPPSLLDANRSCSSVNWNRKHKNTAKKKNIMKWRRQTSGERLSQKITEAIITKAFDQCISVQLHLIHSYIVVNNRHCT